MTTTTADRRPRRPQTTTTFDHDALAREESQPRGEKESSRECSSLVRERDVSLLETRSSRERERESLRRLVCVAVCTSGVVCGGARAGPLRGRALEEEAPELVEVRAQVFGGLSVLRRVGVEVLAVAEDAAHASRAARRLGPRVPTGQGASRDRRQVQGTRDHAAVRLRLRTLETRCCVHEKRKPNSLFVLVTQRAARIVANACVRVSFLETRGACAISGCSSTTGRMKMSASGLRHTSYKHSSNCF